MSRWHTCLWHTGTLRMEFVELTSVDWQSTSTSTEVVPEVGTKNPVWTNEQDRAHDAQYGMFARTSGEQ